MSLGVGQELLGGTGRTAVDGPWQLTVALNRTVGAFLGNVGEGWAEPLTWDNELPPCVDQHLLWHIDIADVPRDDEARDIVFSVGDRIEDAWGGGGSPAPIPARVGDLAGRFDVRKVHE
jgi:hypothetical protein